MTAEPVPTFRRSIWHPLAIAVALVAVTVGVGGTAVAAGGPGWLTLGLWLCVGTTAGFAASGST